jgi:Kef-type K+ transport system membrane component KefB
MLIFGVSALSVLVLHKFKIHPLIGFIFAGVDFLPELKLYPIL